MLGPFRKFSSSIYAKILLGLIIVPFVFWGMGSSFTSGNKNIVVKVDGKKYTVSDIVDYIKRFAPQQEQISNNKIEEILSIFIGEQLIDKEIENYKINLSDKSLAKLILNQKEFQRDNKFSRNEYEKFLLNKNIPAVIFEANLLRQEKKKQLLDFIGGGLTPTKYMVNNVYNKLNQKRKIEFIDLNKIAEKKINLSDEDINSFYEKNKANYVDEFKTIKFLELVPKIITGEELYSDLFFEKLDTMDDLIVQGEAYDLIIKKFNIQESKVFSLNKGGKNKNYMLIKEIPSELVNLIFKISEEEPIALLESNRKYFFIEITKDEIIQKEISNQLVKKEVISELYKRNKILEFYKIANKINEKKFNDTDFKKLSLDEKIKINKTILRGQFEKTDLKGEIVKKIYDIPNKGIRIVSDFNQENIYLINILEVDNVSINANSEEYDKYLKLAKVDMLKNLYNTYDKIIKSKYDIEINKEAFNELKNYFN